MLQDVLVLVYFGIVKRLGRGVEAGGSPGKNLSKWNACASGANNVAIKLGIGSAGGSLHWGLQKNNGKDNFFRRQKL